MAPYSRESGGRGARRGIGENRFWMSKNRKIFGYRILMFALTRSRKYVMSPGRKFEETAFCDT